MTHIGGRGGRTKWVRALGAVAALGAVVLVSESLHAQEFAYCDLSVAQQASKLQLNENATVVTTGLRKQQGIRVTPEDFGQRGSVYHKVPIDFLPGASLYQHFRVRISGTGPYAPPEGADGFAFMVQNDPNGLGAIGEAGQGFGYLGITQSLALELDTYPNSFPVFDPDDNHIALLLGGVNTHAVGGDPFGSIYGGQPEGSTVAPFEPISVATSLESDSGSYDTRDVWIDFACASSNDCTLKVFMTFNNTNVPASFADPTLPGTLPLKPASPILQSTGLSDIAAYLGGSTGYAGFAASTGGAIDEHLVTFWVLSRQPLPDTNANGLEDVCDCMASGVACSGNIPICDLSTATGFCRDCANDAECITKDPTKPYCSALTDGGSGACGKCAVDAHCSSPTPLCNTTTHTCTASCSNDAHCALNQWCDNPTGVPFAGACVSDLANGAAMPSSANHSPVLNGLCSAYNSGAAQTVCEHLVCDVSDNKCGIALDHGTCATSDQCRSGVCVATGANVGLCKPCTAASPGGCTGSTSVCDDTNNVCVGCNGNHGSGSSFACPVSAIYCNLATGACTPNCISDAQCGAGNWCDYVNHPGACVPRLPNGQVVPSGNCTGIGVRACIEGACDVADGTCGIALDHAGCSGTNQCRAGVCVPTGPNAGKCEVCVSDGDCSGATPACDIDTNRCAACTTASPSLCTGSTPLCDGAAHVCVACQRDNGVVGVGACGAAARYCAAGGACGTCSTNEDCVGAAHGGPACITGLCTSQCSSDSDCTATQWCLNQICVGKAANGDFLPSPAGQPAGDAGSGVVCTPALGLRLCLSGACDTIDGRCGLSNGAIVSGDAGAPACRSGVVGSDGKCGYAGATGTCTPSTASSVCRSGTCSPGGLCGCTADGECGGATSGKICNGTTYACVDGCRGSSGNACPAGQVCTSSGSSAGTCGAPVPDAGPDVSSPGPVDASSETTIADVGPVDAGVEAGPVGPTDAAPEAGPVDARLDVASIEAAVEAKPIDAPTGPVDSGAKPMDARVADTGSSVDAALDTGAAEDSGCSCRTASTSGGVPRPALLGALALLGIVVRRRRRASI